MSNAGDDRSVVLNGLRARALSGEESIGLFEWSAVEGCQLDDVDQLAQANPALGHTISLESLAAKRATMPPTGFRTEHLCQRVDSDDPAVDPDAWRASGDVGNLNGLRVVLAADVAPDMSSVVLLAAAALDDGRIRVEVVDAWENVSAARREIPAWVERIKPSQLVWWPQAAALAPDLRVLPNARELSASELTGACQALAAFIASGQLIHPDDPYLTHQVLTASKATYGNGWRFRGKVTALYAMTAAVHYVRHTSINRKGKVRVILPAA